MAHLSNTGSNSVKTNKWVIPDVDIENLIKILRIDKIGIPYVRKLLNDPQSRSYPLITRRNLLQDLHKEFVDSIGSSEKSFSEKATSHLNRHTENLLWFLSDHSEETIEYYDGLFFTWSYLESYLNASPTLLHVSTVSKIYLAPLMTFLGPVLSSFVPIIAMKWYGLDISYAMAFKIVWIGLTYQIKTAVSAIMNGANPLIIAAVGLYLVFYFWGIWTTIQTSLEKYSVLAEIRERIRNLRNFLLDLKEILTDNRNKYFRNHATLTQVDTLLDSLSSNSIGKDLVIFRKLFSVERPLKDEVANPLKDSFNGPLNRTVRTELLLKLEDIIDYSREISGTLCLARLLRIPGYCLPSWYSNETPVMDVKGLCHPSLNSPVPNDIRLSKNLLITGPNQAGKSTFMRSLLLAVWMSQTVGVVRATSYDATPFELIYSYIGLTDEIGLESLFQAEMNAVYEYLNQIKSQEGSKKVHSICFFDELFTSTNHEEGVSAALAVGSTLEQYTNALTVISSHFTELKDLNFDKICLGITTDKDRVSQQEKLNFTYKIQPGISHHRVALRLMKEKGYNPTLVSKAYENLEKLFSKSTNFISDLTPQLRREPILPISKEFSKREDKSLYNPSQALMQDLGPAKTQTLAKTLAQTGAANKLPVFVSPAAKKLPVTATTSVTASTSAPVFLSQASADKKLPVFLSQAGAAKKLSVNENSIQEIQREPAEELKGKLDKLKHIPESDSQYELEKKEDFESDYEVIKEYSNASVDLYQ